MSAFHGKQEVKDFCVTRMRKERDRDNLITALGDEAGYPLEIVHLGKAIFEGLPAEDAPDFALAMFERVQPGADLSLVASYFFVRLLHDNEEGVNLFEQETCHCMVVANLYRLRIAGDEPTEKEWMSVANAARRTAIAVRRSAVRETDHWKAEELSRNLWAVRVAVNAALVSQSRLPMELAWAVNAAARVVASRTGEYAEQARMSAYKRMGEKLIELMAAAPVREEADAT